MTVPEIPPPPQIQLPPVTFPGEIPVPIPMPESNLIGLYVLTNRERLLACAFYPDLPVPEVWIDITPDQVNGANVSITPVGAKVTKTNGDLIFASANRKKLYRASMVGGWFGTRYFEKAVPFFDVGVIDVAAEITHTPRTNNYLGAFGVDVYTDQVFGTVVNADTDDTNPWTRVHHGRTFDGTAYDVGMITDTQMIPIGYPSIDLGVVIINNNRITLSGPADLAEFTGSSWQPLGSTGPVSYPKAWHARPEYGTDVIYTTAMFDVVSSSLHRSKDMFGGGPVEHVALTDMFYPGTGGFSEDGKFIFTRGTYDQHIITVLPPGDLAGTTMIVNQGQGCVTRGSAGTEKITGKQKWGYMTYGRWPNPQDQYNVVPTYYVVNNDNFTDPVDMTPLLKSYLKYGPWGVHTDGLLLEWPIYAWPILG
jgi:hypothetical protein